MEDDLPRRRGRVFTETIPIRVTPEMKKHRQELKFNTDYDISEMERQALEKTYQDIARRAKLA